MHQSEITLTVLKKEFQMTLHAKMSMSDSQRYPLKICQIKFKLDINVHNCLFFSLFLLIHKTEDLIN